MTTYPAVPLSPNDPKVVHLDNCAVEFLLAEERWNDAKSEEDIRPHEEINTFQDLHGCLNSTVRAFFLYEERRAEFNLARAEVNLRLAEWPEEVKLSYYYGALQRARLMIALRKLHYNMCDDFIGMRGNRLREKFLFQGINAEYDSFGFERKLNDDGTIEDTTLQMMERKT